MSTLLSRRNLMHLAWLVACVSLLSACGFQLRGSAHLPFKTLYISSDSSLAVELKRNLRNASDTQVVNEATQKTTPAEATLEILSEQRDKRILSFNAQGRAREYTLEYQVRFRVVDHQGIERLPAVTLTQSRDISFNEGEVLAKENEEALLNRDMQSDLVQQILRRLARSTRTDALQNIPSNAARQ